ncbi:MAG: hypothetical protein WCX69_03320 [Candidatus Paceibacterota bacterium]
MSNVPISIKDHIANARYYLKAADKFPSPVQDGVCILLLLIAQENIQLAREELSNWAKQTTPNKKLYKSHAYKFRKARPITQIYVGRGDDLYTKTITYKNGVDFEKLFSICRYGPKTGRKELASIFNSGWHLDSFRNSLINNIEWGELMVRIHENLLNRPK